jgi:hypothetical protein
MEGGQKMNNRRQDGELWTVTAEAPRFRFARIERPFLP